MLIVKHGSKWSKRELYVFFPLAIALLILSDIFNAKSEILFITKLICLCMSIIIHVITQVNVDQKKIGDMNYIGLAFIYIAIGRFIDLENINEIYINKRNIDFFQFIFYLEILNISASFILCKLKASSKIQHIVYIIILILVFNLTTFNIYLSYIPNISTIYTINFITKMILIGLYLGLITKLDIKSNCKKEIYMIFGKTILIITIINRIFNHEIVLLIVLIKLYMYIMIYNKLENSIFNFAYFKAELDLDKSLKRKMERNRNLKVREKELFELNKNLEKSERTYYNLIKAFYDIIIIFDKNEPTYIDYSKKYYKGKLKDDEYKLITIKIDSVLNEIFSDKYKRANTEELFFTMNIQDENNNEYILEVELKKIYDDKKILTINDITELAKKKEEIIKLEKKIYEENIKDEFYANISHELRTPINVIYSGLQLNSIYIENKEIEKIKGNNKIIKQNCLRLIRTVDNFIDSNKLSENKLTINKKIYNIVNIIDNIVLACNPYMKQRNIKLTFDPEFEEVYMICDKKHIERIMLNILSNSLKYGKDYGNIFLTLLLKDENIIIEVMNDAEAIEEGKRKEIFEKFTKINNSLSRPSEGSGLGLFLTKGLVELSGGSIEIISGKEIGNIFRMTLPYNKEIVQSKVLVNEEPEINELREKINIEFSDIYL